MIEIIAAILFVLRQVSQYLTSIKQFSAGGNLDPLFLLGFIYMITNYKNEALRKKWLLFIGIFVIYAGIQLMISPTLDIPRMFINIMKIVLCVMIMFYIKDTFTSFNYPKFSVIASSLLGFLTLVALIFPQSIFWMLNDVYNKYDPIRLRLLYIEPSELGFHLLILSLIQLGYIFISNNRKTKIILGICLFVNAFIMFWTRSLGAIGIGAISILVMLLMDWYRHRSPQKDLIYGLIIVAGIIVLIAMILLKVSIIMRIYETINGTDPSTFYRVTISFSVSVRALIDSYGMGFGFGNMNTIGFASLYWKFGFAKVLANASSASRKQFSGGFTSPAPTMPIPGFLWAMPVLITGNIPVSTTFLTSIAVGVPRKSRIGIRYSSFSAKVIEYICFV